MVGTRFSGQGISRCEGPGDHSLAAESCARLACQTLWHEGVRVMCSGKQTHSTQDNSDSGVQFITPAGPSQSLLLAKDPDQHCENLLYPMCTCPNHYPKFLETYINKGRVNTITITPSFMCYVFKQLIIGPQLHSDRLITDKPVVTFR